MNWNPVSNPPTKTGDYLVYSPPYMTVAKYYVERNAWYREDYYGEVYCVSFVTHWTKLPKAPT